MSKVVCFYSILDLFVQIVTMFLTWHQNECLTAPIVPSIISAGVFSAVDVMSGQYLTIQRVGTYAGGMYLYNIMQCPMEEIHGRSSLIHNFISAGIIGYAGVMTGRLGIPFIMPYQIPRGVSPPMMGFVMYGSLASAFAALKGKRL